jgi:hypothetical protein
MSIDELLDKEAYTYNRNIKRKTLDSDAAWNNYSYGSRACISSSMDSIMSAYDEYKENVIGW